jgi:hypothetical protein
MANKLDKARSRLRLTIALSIVIVLGLSSRKFADSLPAFIADHAGDALWTVAIYLALAFLAPRWPPLKLFLLAFGISIAVELSQLIDVAWLNALRDTLPGRLLLGVGFLWIDLVRYFCGAAFAFTIDHTMVRSRGTD